MAPTRRNPHPRGEARAAILQAAQRLFAEHGYQATSLRAVATSARVSIPLIYRYFDSKAGLFEQTVVEPGRAFVGAFVHDWDTHPDQGSRDDLVADFVAQLYDFISDNHGLISAWATAGRANPSHVVTDNGHHQALSGLATVLLERDDATDSDLSEAEMTVACTSALVIASVIMEDVIFAANSPLRRRDLIVPAVTRYAQAGSRAPLLADTTIDTR